MAGPSDRHPDPLHGLRASVHASAALWFVGWFLVALVAR